MSLETTIDKYAESFTKRSEFDYFYNKMLIRS